MRQVVRSALELLLVGAAVASAATASCSNGFDTSLGGSTSSSSSGGGSGSSGSSSGACSGAITLDDACAVFVSSDAKSHGSGTMSDPFQKLQDGIDAAGAKPVLACGSFDEAVDVTAALDLVGTFTCAGFVWKVDSSTTAQLTAAADSIPFVVHKSAANVAVTGFAIKAAQASKIAGSSIAVAIDDGVQVSFKASTITASDAMPGSDGTLQGPPENGSAATAIPSAGCAAEAVAGKPGVTMCSDGSMSAGGTGGLGGDPNSNSGNAQYGQAGAPAANDPIHGLGGTPGMKVAECNPGTPGKNGAAGSPGAGGSDSSLTLAGVVGGAGQAGGAGTPAQGGGGGGGAYASTNPSGFLYCLPGPVAGFGASGGGGGAGGCGGLGARPGGAGGSSIAILSLGSGVELVDTRLVTGNGGDGGAGASGTPGGTGGAGHPGGIIDPSVVNPVAGRVGCDGAQGGIGGDGGPSGGGRGGHSLGLAFAVPPKQKLVPSFDGGVAGSGGHEPSGAPASARGSNGQAALCWNFETNAACVP